MNEEQQTLTIIVKATRFGREADNLAFIEKVKHELILRFGAELIESVEGVS